jgi:hypothetical protein
MKSIISTDAVIGDESKIPLLKKTCFGAAYSDSDPAFYTVPF